MIAGRPPWATPAGPRTTRREQREGVHRQPYRRGLGDVYKRQVHPGDHDPVVGIREAPGRPRHLRDRGARLRRRERPGQADGEDHLDADLDADAGAGRDRAERGALPGHSVDLEPDGRQHPGGRLPSTPADPGDARAVSYTHLTLPTIYSV